MLNEGERTKMREKELKFDRIKRLVATVSSSDGLDLRKIPGGSRLFKLFSSSAVLALAASSPSTSSDF
jgi:hypothetical protein